MNPEVVNRLEARAARALEGAGLRGCLLVVAVSGGPDSMALLHCLLRLQESYSLRLHVAHLDHDFRGHEAEEDARFVAEQARRLSLPATVSKADPMEYQRRHAISSFEEAARQVRYDFLARVARETGAEAIALGHTADDQAETVLMHLVRGAGLQGLQGMAPFSPWRAPGGAPAAPLFRPLLEVGREETQAYCQALSIPFRVDTTNLSLRFTRNRIRHRLMPVLRQFNPRIRDSLLRLSRAVSLEQDYVEGQVARAWSQAARHRDGTVTLDRDALASLHPWLRRLVMRQAYQALTGDPRRLEEAHLEAMVQFLDAPTGKVLHLPRGVRLFSSYGTLLLSTSAEPPVPLPPLEGEHGLQVPGETALPGWLVHAQLLDTVPEGAPGGDTLAYLDLEALGGPLTVRARRPGDRFQPLGMEGQRKLQDFLVDQKVPRSWRDRVPLVVSPRGTAWVVGYRIAQWARVTPETRRVLKLSFHPR